MGVVHIRAAYATTAGSPGAKAVLLCLADRACDECGLAWPGIAYICERTEIGTTRGRALIAQLVESGLLRIHAYPKGGRGVTTEYVVLPAVTKLSTAPCAGCQSRKKTHRPGDGFTGPLGTIPTGKKRKTHRTGVDHPLEIQDPSVASPQSVTRPSDGAEASSEPNPGGTTVPKASLDLLRALGILKS